MRVASRGVTYFWSLVLLKNNALIELRQKLLRLRIPICSKLTVIQASTAITIRSPLLLALMALPPNCSFPTPARVPMSAITAVRLLVTRAKAGPSRWVRSLPPNIPTQALAGPEPGTRSMAWVASAINWCRILTIQ